MNPDYTFVRLQQYAALLQDRRFGIDVRNTAIFTGLFLVVCLTIGFFLAVLLDQRLKGENFFRSIYLFPMAISFIVTGVIWRWSDESGHRDAHQRIEPAVRPPRAGLVHQYVAHHASTLGHRLCGDPGCVADVRLHDGSVPGRPAQRLGGFARGGRVDGANEFQIYRHILVPLLQPVTLSAVIIIGHISLKIFDLIVALSQNDMRLDVPAVYMWRTTFDGNNYGQGAAIGIIMLVTVALLIIPYLVYSMRTEATQ